MLSGSAIRRHLAGLLSSLLLFGAPTVAAPSSAVESGTSSISGRVTASGVPHSYDGVYFYRWQDGHWATVSATRSLTDGDYTSPNLQSGEYRVEAVSFDPFHAFYGAGTAVELAESVVVGDAQSVTNIDIDIDMGTVIAGRVTDPSGAPLTSIVVDASDVGGGYWDSVAGMQSSPDGTYVIPLVPPGNYAVRASKNLGRSYWINAPFFELATPVAVSSSSVTGIDLVLDPDHRAVVTPLTAPVVTGESRPGSTLRSSAGSWSPGGGAYDYHYAWQADGVDIPGATADSFLVTAAEIGKRIRVTVVVTHEETSAYGVASSLATPPVTDPSVIPATTLSNERRPKIKGKARVGRTLKVTKGAWSPTEVTLRYRWYAGRKRVPGAVGRRLRLTRKLQGRRVRVRVVATTPGASSVVVFSKRTGRVRAR